MTEQEREFKIKMIQKYQGDLNKEGTQINSLGVLGGVLCLASGLAYLLEYRFIGAAILLLFGSFSITVQIKNLISTIAKKAGIEQEIERLRTTVIKPTKKVNDFLKSINSSELNNGIKLIELLKRTEVRYEDLKNIDENMPKITESEAEEVEIEVKYEGYIKLQMAQVEKFKNLENKILPENIKYLELEGISLEARQKLDKFRPTSIGQASRISGISPADISVLLIYLEQLKRNK